MKLILLLSVLIVALVMSSAEHSTKSPEHFLAGFNIYRLPSEAQLIAKFGKPSSRQVRSEEGSVELTWVNAGCHLRIVTVLEIDGFTVKAIEVSGPRSCQFQTGLGARLGDSIERVSRLYGVSSKSLREANLSFRKATILFQDETQLYLSFSSKGLLTAIRLVSSD